MCGDLVSKYLKQFQFLFKLKLKKQKYTSKTKLYNVDSFLQTWKKTMHQYLAISVIFFFIIGTKFILPLEAAIGVAL